MSNEFIIKKRIGGGAFGAVYKAKNIETNEVVVIKKITTNMRDLSSNELREPAILRDLQSINHPNIIRILGPIHYDQENKLCIPMEYHRDTLDFHKNKCKAMYPTIVKPLFKGILSGVLCCHRRGIMHRDLKPANILVSDENVPKIVDFGLSRSTLFPGDHLTPQIGTPGYRAPELLLGMKDYSYAVDIWSVGCIFYEFFAESSLCFGHSESQELHSIFSALGSPTEREWPGVRDLPYGSYVPEAAQTLLSKSLEVNFQCPEDEGLDLLKKLVALNPSDRITAEEALHHPYFSV